MNGETATPQQRTEAMRKALATIIAEKVAQTNVKVREHLAMGSPPTDDFNSLMFDAGSNVGLLTQALGRVLLFDELMRCAHLFDAGHSTLSASEYAVARSQVAELIARATRDGG